MKPPRCLYTTHGRLAQNLFRYSPTRLRDRVPLAVVRWLLDRFEVWEMRYDLRRTQDEVLRADIVAERLNAVRVALEATSRRTDGGET